LVVKGAPVAGFAAPTSAGAGSTERTISAPAKAAATKLNKPPPIQTARGTEPMELVEGGASGASVDMGIPQMPVLTG
jgi:hypothetical protein